MSNPAESSDSDNIMDPYLILIQENLRERERDTERNPADVFKRSIERLVLLKNSSYGHLLPSQLDDEDPRTSIINFLSTPFSFEIERPESDTFNESDTFDPLISKERVSKLKDSILKEFFKGFNKGDKKYLLGLKVIGDTTVKRIKDLRKKSSDGLPFKTLNDLKKINPKKLSTPEEVDKLLHALLGSFSEIPTQTVGDEALSLEHSESETFNPLFSTNLVSKMKESVLKEFFKALNEGNKAYLVGLEFIGSTRAETIEKHREESSDGLPFKTFDDLTEKVEENKLSKKKADNLVHLYLGSFSEIHELSNQFQGMELGGETSGGR